MKTYCHKFKYWLYHPENTSLLCKNRAFKLKLPQCISCLGLKIEQNETKVINLPKQGPELSQDHELLEWIKEQNMAEIGRMLGDKGIDRQTIYKWIKRGKIPNKYKDLLNDLRKGAKKVA